MTVTTTPHDVQFNHNAPKILNATLPAAAQIGELNQIKAAVQELENFHQKTRQRYEEEITRLREENLALRAASVPPPQSSGPGPSSALGVSGVSLPPPNAFSSQHPGSGRPSDPYDDAPSKQRPKKDSPGMLSYLCFQ